MNIIIKFNQNSFFSKINKLNFILAYLYESFICQFEIQEKELKKLRKYIDILISQLNSPSRVAKNKKLSQLLETKSIKYIPEEEEETILMASNQKQTKKIENVFTPATQGKDINNLRKQLTSHQYYTNIEPYLSERFKKIKKNRRILKNQKFNAQYGNILMSTNPFSQNQAGFIQPQFFNQFANPINTMYMPTLNNMQSNNLDQLQIIHQNSIASINNAPLLTSIDSSVLLQNVGLNPQMLIQNQSQQMSTIIQSTINQQPHALEHHGSVNNYMKLDKVQQSVKKDISKIPDDDYDDDDESESDQRVYEQFSYTYSYMQNDRKKDITIEHHDLKKLVPNQYLNDTIVNFFLKFMEIEMLSDYMKEKVLIFNTYFLLKLAPNDQLENMTSSSFDVMRSTFEKNYQVIRRWIKEDIFEKDYLVFPLNLPEHWSVIIVCNHKNLFEKPANNDTEKEKQGKEGNSVEINDDDSEKMSEEDDMDKPLKDYQKPCLVYFDSFGLLDQKYSNMIRLQYLIGYLFILYINKEFETKKKSTVNINIEYNEKTLPSHQPLIPRQTNYVDCGLYLLEYVENFLNDPQKILSLFSSKDSSDWMNLKWFPRCNIHKKRKFIKELLIDLSKLSKEEAIQNYKDKRKRLIEDKQENDSQFDEVDIDDFEDHIADMTEYEDDYPETEEERHRMLLDFYMNPTYNKYDVF